MTDGFSVDLSALNELGVRLGDVVDQARTLQETLAGITADTGRPDSDEMGRLGPCDAADVLDQFHSSVNDDRLGLAQSTAAYDTTAQDSIRAFGGIG